MAAGYLLDTNVVSEVRKRNGSVAVRDWIGAAHGPTLYLSSLTVGEIRCGVELRRRNDPAQAAVLEGWLHALLRRFGDRIVPVTPEVAEEWGRLNAVRTLPTADGLIAATARVNGWTLVSRNVKDFEGTGVSVLNPFSLHG
ncbi:type II toxin-antitoxin system VapC family toxin [Microbispora cellulosiformans]|uniref:Ribonuclease VapC n=1 Tax=Microbispora cellulosiformans TaxID=2614688 RepID=A0A5J5JZ76_9ACTN|nr:type II toxin-antitoxin system VapC family toxin [Microbispora cellulosiformans]KAA9376929.1 type II toxin-antitoxin system VapC family toxin [Microbispora cellulosiformans]